MMPHFLSAIVETNQGEVPLVPLLLLGAGLFWLSFRDRQSAVLSERVKCGLISQAGADRRQGLFQWGGMAIIGISAGLLVVWFAGKW
jgi:hypothetical protein